MHISVSALLYCFPHPGRETSTTEEGQEEESGLSQIKLYMHFFPSMHGLAPLVEVGPAGVLRLLLSRRSTSIRLLSSLAWPSC